MKAVHYKPMLDCVHIEWFTYYVHMGIHVVSATLPQYLQRRKPQSPSRMPDAFPLIMHSVLGLFTNCACIILCTISYSIKDGSVGGDPLCRVHRPWERRDREVNELISPSPSTLIANLFSEETNNAELSYEVR